MKPKALILLIMQDQSAYEFIRYMNKSAMSDEVDRSIELLLILKEFLDEKPIDPTMPSNVIQITKKKD